MNNDYWEHLAGLTNKMLDHQAKYLGYGKGPSEVESWKSKMQVCAETLMHFRSNNISKGNLNFPDRPPYHSTSFTEYPVTPVYENLKATTHVVDMYNKLISRLPSSYQNLFSLLAQESLYSAGWGAKPRLINISGLGLVSECSIRSSYYALRIMQLFKISTRTEPTTFIEIGSGFGMTAEKVLTVNTEAKFIIIDLFPNASLALAYISSVFGPDMVRLATGSDQVSAFGKDLLAGNIRCLILPPWLLPTLSTKADVVLNTMSFQHMNSQNLEFYSDYFKTIDLRFLYQVNRSTVRDPEDVVVANQPWQSKAEILHEQVIYASNYIEQFLMLRN